MRLLIVEDDAKAAKQLVADMAEFGHALSVATDGRAAVAMVTDQPFDAILLDVMLPHVDGVEVAQILRARNIAVPIIMLSALGDLDQRLTGLDAGADDYLVKPAPAIEIDARLRAIIRRTAVGDTSGILRIGDIEVNEVKHRALRAGRLVKLPKLEFSLLCELMRNANSVVTKPMLYEKVWHYDFEPRTNIAESYIRRLRAQLNEPGERDPIVTVRGVGYMFEDRG